MALDYLHRELQIIHTDVKPENVVVSVSLLELSPTIIHHTCNFVSNRAFLSFPLHFFQSKNSGSHTKFPQIYSPKKENQFFSVVVIEEVRGGEYDLGGQSRVRGGG